MDEKQDATPVEPQGASTEPQDAQIVRGDIATREKKLGGVTGKGFMPGQSGNPSGRPKRTPITDAIREVATQLVPGDAKGRTYAQVYADKQWEMALAGDLGAQKEIADRIEGKARQTIDIGNAALREAYERLSEEELKAYVNDGRLPPWFPRGEAIDDEAAR